MTTRKPDHSHSPSHAAKLAGDDMKKVIQTFSDGPQFMGDTRDPRTIARHETIANAPPEVQALAGQGFTQEFLHALAKIQARQR